MYGCIYFNMSRNISTWPCTAILHPTCVVGVFLDMYARGKDNMAAGIILYGSYISKSAKLSDYPVPVLTMSGDQDGLCRMTRIAEDFG